MLEPGKLATSLLRAAAIVAGAVILTPFCAFPDPITFTVTAGPTPVLVEGGAAGTFVLTVQNISTAPIKVVSVGAAITARGGLDTSDTLAALPTITKDACSSMILASSAECTITYSAKPVGNGPPETEVPVDFGLTQVEFTVGTIPAPPLIPVETKRSALADFRVEDVPAVPEPATLTLFGVGAFLLTALMRPRRRDRGSAAPSRTRLRS
jgi:hypothetical protein